jgi:putative ABC transport system permease protein
MGLVALLRAELLDTWQAQLPKDAPNHFALNILPDERQPFAERLAQVNATSAPLYPVTPAPGHINEQPVRQFVSKESTGERAIQRDLSLTWAAELPQGNALSAGSWWQQRRRTTPYPAYRWKRSWPSLNLQLGDLLTFDIGGQQRQARVSSLRTCTGTASSPTST